MKIKWPTGCSGLSVFSERSKDVLRTLYKSIVRSILEYSCPVWNPSLMQDIKTSTTNIIKLSFKQIQM